MALTFDHVMTVWTDAGIRHAAFESKGRIHLSKIIVREERRGYGIGTAAMQLLMAYADQSGQRIELTPSSDFGGSKTRLEQFYKQLGFVKNHGKHKDFTTQEAMYREPVAARLDIAAAGGKLAGLDCLLAEVKPSTAPAVR